VAVGLALISAVLFGGMSVGLRLGLNRRPDVALATLATVVGAFAVSFVFAAAESPSRGWHAGAAWPFLLAGILQPGVGQLLVTMAIREAGASRASVVFGVARASHCAAALTAALYSAARSGGAYICSARIDTAVTSMSLDSSGGRCAKMAQCPSPS